MDRILQYLSSYFDWFFIPKITVFDVIDVVVVTFIVYELLIWIKNTRAWTLLKGIVFICFQAEYYSVHNQKCFQYRYHCYRYTFPAGAETCP